MELQCILIQDDSGPTTLTVHHDIVAEAWENEGCYYSSAMNEATAAASHDARQTIRRHCRAAFCATLGYRCRDMFVGSDRFLHAPHSSRESVAAPIVATGLSYPSAIPHAMHI